MKRATTIMAALALLLGGVGQAKASLITSLPSGTIEQMPNQFYEGFGPQLVQPGITWSSTNDIALFGENLGYSFVADFGWNRNGMTTMAGINDSTGSMTFAFSTAQLAVGGFINYVEGETATIAVYDSGNNLIESYTLTFSTGGGTDTGEFLGFQEATADISYFTLSGGYIGLTDLTNLPQAASTPEPSSLVMLGMAAASFGGYFGWRRRKLPVPG
jgi:hypothetical protein